MAGDARFTVSNANGVSFKYQVKRNRGQETSNRLGSFLVYTYEDIDRRTYIGRLNEFTGLVSLSSRSRVDSDTLSFQVVRWICNVLWTNRDIPAGYTAGHNSRCGHCSASTANLFCSRCAPRNAQQPASPSRVATIGSGSTRGSTWFSNTDYSRVVDTVEEAVHQVGVDLTFPTNRELAS